MKTVMLPLLFLVLLVCYAEGDNLSDMEMNLLLKLNTILEKQKRESMVNEEHVREEDNLERELNEMLRKKKRAETNTVTDEKCEDKEDNCYTLAINGACANDEENMKKKCAMSCKFCCKDVWPVKACKRARKFGFCETGGKRIQIKCAKTCGECGIRLPAPPQCLNNGKFGCCWDRSTARLLPIEYGDSKYNGCPPCKDKDETMCKRFKSDCEDLNKLKGNQIRKFCPVTCGLCGDGVKTRDFADQKACKMYKLQGLCKTSEKTMRFYCAKTCGLTLNASAVKKCRDNTKLDCKLLVSHNMCNESKFKERMERFCPVSCGVCNDV